MILQIYVASGMSLKRKDFESRIDSSEANSEPSRLWDSPKVPSPTKEGSDRFRKVQERVKAVQEAPFPDDDFLDWVYKKVNTSVSRGDKDLTISVKDVRKVTKGKLGRSELLEHGAALIEKEGFTVRKLIRGGELLWLVISW